MKKLIKRDIVRPGRTPLQFNHDGRDQPGVQSSLQLNMNTRSISVDSDTGVALVLLRKKSIFDGLFGYSYILEDRQKKSGTDFPGKYALFGGKLEYDVSRDMNNPYERAREAASRELREETGINITPNSLLHVISAVLHREGSSRIGVEVFINNDTSEDMIDVKAIEKYQAAQNAEAEKLRNELAELKAAGVAPTHNQFTEKEALLEGLKDKTNVGPPKVIRRMNVLGYTRWMMIRGPFWRPLWHNLSPLAAYSLLADPSYEAAVGR